ncbi:MAG: ShlB/FhaC/HecB family hemolysin secretion/activation protein [Pseudomonadota bacterium]
MNLLRVWLAALLLTVAVAGELRAQNLVDPGADLLREQQRQRSERELERARPGRSVTTKVEQPVEREKVCFPIATIRLQGVTAVKSADLVEVLTPFKDTCMGEKAIARLIAKLTSVYVEAGFITTRVYVPQQDLKSKVLVLNVLEGRIEAFVYRTVDEAGVITAGKPRKITTAFPITAGDIFQLRAIEQGLDQINRLQSSQATVDLLPGSKPGMSVVVITERKVDTVRGFVTYDNNGSEETGRHRVKVSVEADDLFFVNDTASLTYAGTENSNVLAYNASVPYGNWTFSSYGSYSESVDDLTSLSVLFSQTASSTVQAEYMLHRNSRAKYWGYGAAGVYWNKRHVNVSQLTPQTRTTVRAGFKQEHHFERGVLSVDTAVTLGVPMFGADTDRGVLADDVPRAKFAKLDVSASYLHRFENGSRLISSLNGQFASDPLYSNEQLTIGGWDSVRGYQGTSVSGEDGVLLRNDYYLATFEHWSDLSKAFGFPHEKQSLIGAYVSGYLQPYVFADIGHVHDKATDTNSTLAGFGGGVRYTADRLSVNAAIAVPILEKGEADAGSLEGLINVTFKMF